MPLKKASNIFAPQIIDKIYEISEGILGNVAVIVKESAIEAIETGTEKITFCSSAWIVIISLYNSAFLSV